MVSEGRSGTGLFIVNWSTCNPTRDPAASLRVRGSEPEAADDSCLAMFALSPGTFSVGSTPPAAIPGENMPATSDRPTSPPPARLKPMFPPPVPPGVVTLPDPPPGTGVWTVP